jgi:hypothetical protein
MWLQEDQQEEQEQQHYRVEFLYCRGCQVQVVLYQEAFSHRGKINVGESVVE